MNYVGIDLGTTNSAICSFDGETMRLHKNSEQGDVTPSVIFIDRKGNKRIGPDAYRNLATSEGRAAVKFKRLMGSRTPISLTAADMTFTPEQCSAEILRHLFGLLPEEFRVGGVAGTVITVPAAFDQMQKEATLCAAETAGIGSIALMQEPVAAVMSAMRHRKGDGRFVIYDLGGGTLDVAIADGSGGRVTLLAQHGISRCGGADFDQLIFDQCVKPWLLKNFDLPPNFDSDPRFRAIAQIGLFQTERAKIDLSARDETFVTSSDGDLRLSDLAGKEIDLHVPISRVVFDRLISERISDSIQAVRETLDKAQLTSRDVDRIVFVGGPTQYKPLRDKVCDALGIPPSSELNPMTAVAEGAAIFAESIDWSSENRGRKTNKGSVAASDIGVSFNFVSRTPDAKSRVVAKQSGAAAVVVEFQADSPDTGWSSGRVSMRDGAFVELPLAKSGDNRFKIFAFDRSGTVVRTEQITITRTEATVDAIPASHSIGVEVRSKLGGQTELVKLVSSGDSLPKKGREKFLAQDSLKAGSSSSLKFKLWEGEFEHPIEDNRFVGLFEIKGTDFDHGVVPAGAEVFCDYLMTDAGNIILEVTIPSVSSTFNSGKNYYSPQGVNLLNDQARISEDANAVRQRIDKMQEAVRDPSLDQARQQLDFDGPLHDSNSAQQAIDKVGKAKKLLSEARHRHLKDIRQQELDEAMEFFERAIRRFARQSEASSFDSAARTAQSYIDNGRAEFEAHLGTLHGLSFSILWRQDWFAIDLFKSVSKSAHEFDSAAEYAELLARGNEALKANDMERLREVIMLLNTARSGGGGIDDFSAVVNIVRA
jgi:molecular chaperone DnaK